MLFCTINIPLSAIREGESNEEAFDRIMDTFMGEYEIESQDFSYEALGTWVKKMDKRFPKDSFPCAWKEDEEGNICDYYIFSTTRNDKILKHMKAY